MSGMEADSGSGAETSNRAECGGCGPRRDLEAGPGSLRGSEGRAVLLPSGNPRAALASVAGWNWGAFALSFLWAFSHGLPLWGWVVLLAHIAAGPVGFALSLYLGAQGNELAWAHRRFRDVEHFRATQRVWQLWGLATLTIPLILAIAALAVLRQAATAFT
jgi:hypothetical protein